MAQTVTKVRPTKMARPTTKVTAKAAGTHKPAAAPPMRAVDRTTKLSKEVMDSVEKGQRAAIDAVRDFIDTVDRALPLRGESPSRRQEVIDSAMKMADRLVHTQYDFIRRLIDSAGESLDRTDDKK